jgi:hypothetical protein
MIDDAFNQEELVEECDFVAVFLPEAATNIFLDMSFT